MRVCVICIDILVLISVCVCDVGWRRPTLLFGYPFLPGVYMCSPTGMGKYTQQKRVARSQLRGCLVASGRVVKQESGFGAGGRAHLPTARPHPPPSTSFPHPIPLFTSYSLLLSHAQVIPLPKLSHTMTSGRLVKWHKQPGDAIAAYDVIMEVEVENLVEEVFKVGRKAGQNETIVLECVQGPGRLVHAHAYSRACSTSRGGGAGHVSEAKW